MALATASSSVARTAPCSPLSVQQTRYTTSLGLGSGSTGSPASGVVSPLAIGRPLAVLCFALGFDHVAPGAEDRPDDVGRLGVEVLKPDRPVWIRAPPGRGRLLASGDQLGVL